MSGRVNKIGRSRLQQPAMAQRPLQRWLHLHLAELAYGEVEMLQRLPALVWVVFEHQLSELEAREGKLGAEADLRCYLQDPVVIAPGLLGLAQQRRRPAEDAGGTGKWL
jgi:hypothetical protein